jgi:probable rRNA maturation factor
MPKDPIIPNVAFHFLKKDFSLRTRTKLKKFIVDLFKKEKKGLISLDYIFCSDSSLLTINQNYLKHDFFTDIISFDLSGKKDQITGEVYISIDRVRENAVLYNTSFKEELHRVIFHGALHLCGFQDKTNKQAMQMRRMEDRYLTLFFSK